MSEFIEGLRLVIKARAEELAPKVKEYQMLLEMQEITDAWLAEREATAKALTLRARPKPTGAEVRKWIEDLQHDAFSKQRLADEFGMNTAWATRTLRRMQDDEYLERFGNGLFRQPPKRTGSTRLSVVTR